MPGKRGHSDEGWEEEEDIPDLTTVREYSDFVIYYVRNGRFQYHPLLDERRRQGILTLLTAQRITKLTTERRLKPVKMSFTAGEVEQRVYLFSIVRDKVTTEELDDYVRRLNDYLSGMTTSEKEAAVRDLITKTPARVRPGVRNLPVDVYEEGEAIPPVRDIDDEGHPTLDTEEETVVFKRGEPRQTTKRKGDISMPSTSALLPDPHTDTESSHSSGSKRRTPDSEQMDVTPDQNVQENQPPAKRGKGGQPSPKKSRVEETPVDESQAYVGDFVDYGPGVVEESTQTSDRSQSARTAATAATSTALSTVTSYTVDEFMARFQEQSVTKNEFQSTMDELRNGLSNLNALVTTLVKFQTGDASIGELANAAGLEAPKGKETLRLRRGGTETRSKASSEPDPMYNDSESLMLGIFPINIYTKPVDWLLKRPIVQRFIKYEIIRQCYTGLPPSKPDWEIVLDKYFKFLVSTRLAAHLGKPLRGRSVSRQNLDFGRFPLPKVIETIAETELVTLHKVKVEGQRSNADLFKEKEGSAKKNHLNGSPYIVGAPTVEDLAQRLYWERMDFFDKHQEHFPGCSKDDWPFRKELAKAKKLTAAQGKPSNKDFQFAENPPEGLDIQDEIFKGMSKGRPVMTMEEAQALEAELIESGVSKPRMPESTWKLIREEVYPSREEIAIINQKAKAKKKTHEKRLTRRRDKYSKSHPRKSEESDSEDEDEGEPLPVTEGEGTDSEASDDGLEQPDAPGDDQQDDAGEKEPAKTRQEHVQELFGSVSDISSSDNGTVQAAVNKAGQMVFLAKDDDEDEGMESGGNDVAAKSPGDDYQIVTHVSSSDVLAKAIQQGIGSVEMDMDVTTNTSQHKTATYTVVVSNPNESDQEPTVMKGASESSSQSSESIRRPGTKISSKSREALRRFADMEEDFPDMSSSSTTTNSSESGHDTATKDRSPLVTKAPGTKGSKESKDKPDTQDITKQILSTMGPPTSPAWKGGKPKKSSKATHSHSRVPKYSSSSSSDEATDTESKDKKKPAKPDSKGHKPAEAKGKGKGKGKSSAQKKKK